MNQLPATRTWRPAWPCPVGAMLAQRRRGAADPTWTRTTTGWFLASSSPEGAATLYVRSSPRNADVELSAWGPGADWVLEQAPAQLGDADEVPAGPWAPHPVVDAARRALPHQRIGRTDQFAQVAVPTVIEQKVTGQEAFGAYRTLVSRFGTPAPGPGRERALLVPPTLEQWSALPSWEWIRAQVDHQRAGTITQVLRVASSLERRLKADHEAADSVLRATVPGIGVWTSAEIRARNWGDPDAVSFADYHLAADIGWAVTGHPFDDAQLAEFLAPWQGQRGRVALWIRTHCGTRPRRGARMAPRAHLPRG